MLLGRQGPVLRGQGQWAFLLAGWLGGTERSALFTPSPWAPAHETWFLQYLPCGSPVSGLADAQTGRQTGIQMVHG